MQKDLEMTKQTPRVAHMDKEIQGEFDNMARDERESVNAARCVRTQLAKALSIAMRATQQSSNEQLIDS
jgi:hypothetical protein